MALVRRAEVNFSGKTRGTRDILPELRFRLAKIVEQLEGAPFPCLTLRIKEYPIGLFDE
jgi:hypothetical protein